MSQLSKMRKCFILQPEIYRQSAQAELGGLLDSSGVH
jgi:hypothetical protein